MTEIRVFGFHDSPFHVFQINVTIPDRRIKYANNEFRGLLKTNEIQCSMSRRGDCWDNAVAESLFHSLKVELTHGKTYNAR
jgi:putative transposase